MCTMDANTADASEEDLVSKIDARRSNKPLMEKKRRQRINRCLNELKTLVLEALKKDPSRYSKLEKADILEMTVRHVQALHRYEAAGGRMVGGGRLIGSGRSVGSDDKAKYRAGFTQCAIEVTRYLGSMSGVPNDLHKKVISHLNSVTGVPGVVHASEVPSGGASVVVGGGVVTVAPPATGHTSSAAPLVITTAADSTSTGGLGLPDHPDRTSFRSPPPLISPVSSAVSSSSVTVGAGVTLVPARLASGQMALVLPPGTALPHAGQTSHSIRDPINKVITSTPSSNNIPGIPSSPANISSGTDTGSTTSTQTFIKDARNVSPSSHDNSVYPLRCQTPKGFTFTLPKNLYNSYDVNSGIFSSHLSSSKTHPLASESKTHRLDAPDLLAKPTSLPLSSNNDDTSCTHTTCATSQVMTLSPHSTGIENQVALNRSECCALAIPPNVNGKVTSTLSNFSASSWPTLVRPTPTLPQGVQATTSAVEGEQPQQHTLQPLFTPTTAPPAAAPTPPPSAASHEPLNLVTHDHSRGASCSRRSYKAPSTSVWRRAAPYRIPQPGRRAQPWRPW
ncbi:uncharacterized protein [Panulirus ornatus]|uniref:uncharacterized protein n=1 Tax=Panulirus ornatus TaxID=150431 RepID=UPI003A83A4AF